MKILNNIQLNHWILPSALILLMSSCGSSEQAAGTATGAYFGGGIGSAIGGILGGPRGSDIGYLFGTVGGAVAGAALTAPTTEKNTNSDYAYNDYSYSPSSNYSRTPSYSNHSYSYTTPSNQNNTTFSYHYSNSEKTDASKNASLHYSPLVIRNVVLFDLNKNGEIDADERGTIVFEIMNEGSKDMTNLTAGITFSGVKHLYVSPPTMIERIPAGGGVRYTAEVHASPKVKSGVAQMTITVYNNNADVEVESLHELKVNGR